MINRPICCTPFSIVYTKTPHFIVDLTKFPNPNNKATHLWAKDYILIQKEIRAHIEQMNAIYKEYEDNHKKLKEFEEGELILIYLNKHRLPFGCSKSSNKKYGPFLILKKINNNSYVIDLASDWHISSTFNVIDISPTYHPLDDVVTSIMNYGLNSLQERKTRVGVDNHIFTHKC